MRSVPCFYPVLSATPPADIRKKVVERAMFLQSGFVDLAVVMVIFMVMGFVMLVNL